MSRHISNIVLIFDVRMHASCRQYRMERRGRAVGEGHGVGEGAGVAMPSTSLSLDLYVALSLF